MNLASILGPAIGGTLLSVTGPYTVFSINSACFLLVGAAVLTWRRLYCRLPLEKFAQSLIGAIRYVRYTPGVQVVLARNFLFAVFISAIPALLPIVALKKLHLSPGELGLVFTSMGVGALLCAVLVLPFGRARLSPNLLTLVANILLCAVFMIMALVRLQLLLSEHLRQHERMTKFEQKTLEIAASYHLDGEPVPVQHFLSVDREVLLLGQTAK